jgi:mannose-6-phosphate isomerase
VWGGRRLGEVLGKPLPAAGPHGESWEISDHPVHRSVVEGDGRTLRDLLTRDPEALLGATRPGPFPLLVKFVDVCDRLSVQVHPDDEAAGRLWPGEGGKTEAWFVLAARPGSRVYAGLLPGVDEARLRSALAAGKAAECLHQFEPQPGDCLSLPAGTVHAAGGGVLLAEVQQTSDATFRLYDWDRNNPSGPPRKLHVEEAIACIDWSAGPVQPVRARGYKQGEPDGGGLVRQRLVEGPFFRLEHLRLSGPAVLPGGRMQIVVVLYGRGALASDGGREALRVGDVLLLPAALARAECEPEGVLGILLATLPEGRVAAGSRSADQGRYPSPFPLPGAGPGLPAPLGAG